MGAIRGIECVVYFNASINALPYANPLWQVWGCVRDTTLNLTFDEVDASCRGGGGFRASDATLTSIEVTGNALKDKDDAGFVALEALAIAKTSVDVMVLDGLLNSANSSGWRFVGKFFSWSEAQPFEDILKVDFTLKPTRSANPPVFVEGPIV